MGKRGRGAKKKKERKCTKCVGVDVDNYRLNRKIKTTSRRRK